MATAEDLEERLAQPFSIIYLSSQDRDAALRTNRQQVMLRAARRGFLADGTTTFILAVEEALGRNGEAEPLRRKKLAARNSWEARNRELATWKPAV